MSSTIETIRELSGKYNASVDEFKLLQAMQTKNAVFRDLLKPHTIEFVAADDAGKKELRKKNAALLLDFKNHHKVLAEMVPAEYKKLKYDAKSKWVDDEVDTWMATLKTRQTEFGAVYKKFKSTNAKNAKAVSDGIVDRIARSRDMIEKNHVAMHRVEAAKATVDNIKKSILAKKPAGTVDLIHKARKGGIIQKAGDGMLLVDALVYLAGPLFAAKRAEVAKDLAELKAYKDELRASIDTVNENPDATSTAKDAASSSGASA